MLSFADRMDQHATDQICSLSNSVFQTSCGRMVGVSSAELVKAKTLLGLEENYKLCTSQDTAGRSVSDKMIGMSNLRQMENGVCGSHRTASMHPSGPSDTSSIQQSTSYCQGDRNSSKSDAFPNILGPDPCKSFMKQPPIKFQTAGGRSITVSSDALQRARSLLGDVELEVLPNEFTAHDPSFSYLTGDKNCKDASLNKENVPYASLLPQNSATSKCPVNGFPPHTGLFLNQRQSSSQTEAASSGGDVLKHDGSNGGKSEGIYWSNNNFTSIQKPPSDNNHASLMVVNDSFEKDIASRTVLQGRAPLVDVSNKIKASCANQKYLTSEKRRLGKRSSISPFKRPRSSRLVAFSFIHLL